jgi:hypothetical protein
MKNLIQDTLGKIKKQQIAPEPRWKYLFRKYLIWVAAVIVVVLGAISLSAAYDNVISLDWDLYHFMHENMLEYFFSMLPYFWLILLSIFLLVAFFEIRRTETGYRYSWSKISLIIVGGIVTFGLLISFLGLGKGLNSKLAKEIPFYGQHMIITKESQWMQPSRGFLAGTIIDSGGNNLEVDDLNGKEWSVEIDSQTLIRPAVDLKQKETIKIIGNQKNGNNFKAEEIRPWAGKGQASATGGQKGGIQSGGQRGGVIKGR